MLIDLFGGEREATRILGGVQWWQVRAGGEQGCVFVFGAFLSCGSSSTGDDMTDCRVDAEWIMEKKDLRQQRQQKSEHQERTPASPAGGASGGSQMDSSGSSPLEDHGLGGDGTDHVEANAYRPEMDEMRCLLWAHGGSSVCPFVRFIA